MGIDTTLNGDMTPDGRPVHKAELEAALVSINNTIGAVANVLDKGAVGDFSTDCSEAFQAAVDTGLPVFVPPGYYILGTPVTYTTGTQIFGLYGGGLANSRSAIIPTTAAFRPENAQTQYGYLHISGLEFIGGTYPLDLGLTSYVTLRDLAFDAPSGAAISHVRGQNVTYKNLNMKAKNSNGTFALLTLADTTHTTLDFTGFSDVVFIDRIDFAALNCGNASDGTGAQYAIYQPAGQFSGGSLRGLTAHSCLDGALYCNQVHTMTISGITLDGIGADGDAAADVYRFSDISDSVFNGFKCHSEVESLFYTNWMNFIGDVQGLVCNGIFAPGDNSSTFGFKFADKTGMNAVLNACQGALFHGSSSQATRNEIKPIGCKFDASNVDAAV